MPPWSPSQKLVFLRRVAGGKLVGHTPPSNANTVHPLSPLAVALLRDSPETGVAFVIGDSTLTALRVEPEHHTAAKKLLLEMLGVGSEHAGAQMPSEMLIGSVANQHTTKRKRAEGPPSAVVVVTPPGLLCLRTAASERLRALGDPHENLVRVNGDALHIVPGGGRDPVLARRAVQQSPAAIRHVPSDAPHFAELALNAVKVDGHALALVPASVAGWAAIAAAAVMQNPGAFRWVQVDGESNGRLVCEHADLHRLSHTAVRDCPQLCGKIAVSSALFDTPTGCALRRAANSRNAAASGGLRFLHEREQEFRRVSPSLGLATDEDMQRALITDGFLRLLACQVGPVARRERRRDDPYTAAAAFAVELARDATCVARHATHSRLHDEWMERDRNTNNDTRWPDDTLRRIYDVLDAAIPNDFHATTPPPPLWRGRDGTPKSSRASQTATLYEAIVSDFGQPGDQPWGVGCEALTNEAYAVMRVQAEAEAFEVVASDRGRLQTDLGPMLRRAVECMARRALESVAICGEPLAEKHDWQFDGLNDWLTSAALGACGHDTPVPPAPPVVASPELVVEFTTNASEWCPLAGVFVSTANFAFVGASVGALRVYPTTQRKLVAKMDEKFKEALPTLFRMATDSVAPSMCVSPAMARVVERGVVSLVMHTDSTVQTRVLGVPFFGTDAHAECLRLCQEDCEARARASWYEAPDEALRIAARVQLRDGVKATHELQKLATELLAETRPFMRTACVAFASALRARTVINVDTVQITRAVVDEKGLPCISWTMSSPPRSLHAIATGPDPSLAAAREQLRRVACTFPHVHVVGCAAASAARRYAKTAAAIGAVRAAALSVVPLLASGERSRPPRALLDGSSVACVALHRYASRNGT